MPSSAIDGASAGRALSFGQDHLTFDRMHKGIDHQHNAVTAQAISFLVLQLAGRTAHSRLALFLNPGRKFFSLDPYVVVRVPEVGRAARKPIAQGAFWDVEFFGDFASLILHRQQPRGLDNHKVWDFD
jgi:hypothetical protein